LEIAADLVECVVKKNLLLFQREDDTVKTKQIGFWTLILVFIISGLFLFSCSKTKEVKKEEIVSKPPAVVKEGAEKPKEQVRTGDQELREKALREEEARRLKEAAEKALFETEDVHFEFDQAIISETDKQILNKKAKWLKDFPTAKASIEGHCDERGSAEYNLALGQRRADATMTYLTTLGVAANRLSTISYGKENPLDTGSNEAAWAKNRRAHFVLK
jgi:peptidoglycan-associated lipoprotein